MQSTRSTQSLKRLVSVVALLLVAFMAYVQRTQAPAKRPAESSDARGDDLAQAIQNRENDVQVQGHGTVVRILPDDNEGSRHQKFIIRLDSGQTVLISHNIDAAPRIPKLRVEDVVEFHGEYEWNSQGGVIHWTHRDSTARHPDGWLKHGGQTFQ